MSSSGAPGARAPGRAASLLCLLLLGFAAGAGDAFASHGELAQGKPATASSTSASAGAPGAANDGNAATRWSSNYAAAGEWWRVGLGANLWVSAVEVDWENATASPYRIQVSPDGVAWTTAATQTLTSGGSGVPGALVRTSFTPVRGRYVRIVQDGRGPGNCCYGMSFWEVRVFGSATAPPPGDPVAGTMQFAKPAESSFDLTMQKAVDGDLALRAFMQAKYDRMRVYDNGPAHEASDQGWLPRAWEYSDAYAIYPTGAPGTPPDAAQDQWVLRDGQGRRMYINFACSGSYCTQYAANVCDQSFRDWWIAQVAPMASRYGGVFMDDANIARNVSDGAGNTSIDPINYLDGTTLTEAEWGDCMATFVEQVKAAIGPDAELAINTVYYQAGGRRDSNVERALLAADLWEIERGFNDTGITGGTGTFGYERLLEDIAWAQSHGKGVILDVQTSSGEQYARANYLLISTARDYTGGPLSDPDSWWTGWDTDLGAPLQFRTKNSAGVWERRFQKGTVYVNPPGNPPWTSAPGGTLAAADGRIVLDTTPPSAPPNLSAAPGNSQVTLSWSQSTDDLSLAGYKVYRSGGSLVGQTNSAAATTYTETSLTNGTQYCYYVRAFDSAGNQSAPSSTVCATPNANIVARDEFNQTAGALAGKTAPLGGTWAGAGDADDFQIYTGARTARRTAVSDTTFPTGARLDLLSPVLSATGAQADVKYSGQSSDVMGLVVRYTNTSNWLGAYVTSNVVRVVKVVGGVDTLIALDTETLPVDTWKSIRIVVDTAGRVWMWVWPRGGAVGQPRFVLQDDALAAGGVLDDGKAGLLDHHSSATAGARNWDNFVAYIP